MLKVPTGEGEEQPFERPAAKQEVRMEPDGSCILRILICAAN